MGGGGVKTAWDGEGGITRGFLRLTPSLPFPHRGMGESKEREEKFLPLPPRKPGIAFCNGSFVIPLYRSKYPVRYGYSLKYPVRSMYQQAMRGYHQSSW